MQERLSVPAVATALVAVFEATAFVHGAADRELDLVAFATRPEIGVNLAIAMPTILGRLLASALPNLPPSSKSHAMVSLLPMRRHRAGGSHSQIEPQAALGQRRQHIALLGFEIGRRLEVAASCRMSN